MPTKSILNGHQHQELRLSDPCYTAVDLAAKLNKVDRFGQHCLGATFHSLSSGFGISICGYHDHGNIRTCRFCLGQHFKSAHPGHVDVGQDQYK